MQPSFRLRTQTGLFPFHQGLGRLMIGDRQALQFKDTMKLNAQMPSEQTQRQAQNTTVSPRTEAIWPATFLSWQLK